MQHCCLLVNRAFTKIYLQAAVFNLYVSGLVLQAISRIRLHRQPKVLTLLSLWVLGLLAMWLPAPQTIDAPALQHYEEKLDEAAAGDHAHSLAMQVGSCCSCRLVLLNQGLSVSRPCGSLWELETHPCSCCEETQGLFAAGLVAGAGGAGGAADLVLVPGALKAFCG